MSVIFTISDHRLSVSGLSLFNKNITQLDSRRAPSTRKRDRGRGANTVITPSQNSSEFQTAAQHGKCRRASSLSARESRRRQITALPPLPLPPLPLPRVWAACFTS